MESGDRFLSFVVFPADPVMALERGVHIRLMFRPSIRLVGETILEVDEQPNSGIYLVGRSRVTGTYSCRLLPGDRKSTSVLFSKMRILISLIT